MKIPSLFSKGKTILSFEIFPPKRNAPIDTIYATLEGLSDLKPAFISVTYGTSGEGETQTCAIADIIKHKYGIEPMAHMTCIGSSKDDIKKLLADLRQSGIENILALRGDLYPGAKQGEFSYADELISFIKENGDFSVSGACYPEGHMESPDKIYDIKYLKNKVDAGASHLLSQLFFDNSHFYSFVEKARIAGINVPIEAGIMPVTNKKQIEKMVTLCGASLPPKFVRIMQRYEDHPSALRDAGIAYAVDQIVDLVTSGVDGVHLYTMNNPYVARKICDSVSGLFNLED